MDTNTTVVRKNELLEKLHQTLAKHKADYLQASADYKLSVQERLKDHIDALTNLVGKEISSADVSTVQRKVWDGLHTPEDHSSEIQSYIEMLAMNPNEAVTLTFEQFNQMVLNKWRWVAAFEAAMVSNRGYLGSKGL